MSRVIGVYSAGRIINPLTARTQMIGGITWGIGEAMLEQSVLDTRLGRFIAKNLAGYLVPVNADVPEPSVSFVDEIDMAASTIGGKGIGELGATGVSPAIANAVYNATGSGSVASHGGHVVPRRRRARAHDPMCDDHENNEARACPVYGRAQPARAGGAGLVSVGRALRPASRT